MLSGIFLKFEILYCPKNISDLTAFSVKLPKLFNELMLYETIILKLMLKESTMPKVTVSRDFFYDFWFCKYI